MEKLFCIVLFIGLSNSLSPAQGGYAGAFLRMGVAARSEAMGRAHVAMAQSSEGLFFNPATAAFLSAMEVNASVRKLALDRSFVFVNFATPVRPRPASAGAKPLNAGVAISWIHAGVDNIEARDFDGEKYATLSSAENAFAFSFAVRPHPKFAVGLTARYVYNRFPNVKNDDGALSASSFGFDLGALLEPLAGVRLGAALQNVNLKYVWNTQDVYEQGSSTVNRFPRGASFGVAVNRPYPWLTIVADVEKRQFRDGMLHLGAQAAYRELLQLRAGLNDGEPTFGAGFRFALFGRATELHYAYATHPDNLDGDHIFGWAFIF
jgi:hypothetical protein